MKKIGIATVYTGFNYGSVLQAFAMRATLKRLGWDGELLHLHGSFIPGRDIRFIKLFTIAARTALRPKELNRIFKLYRSSVCREIPNGSKELFNQFIDQYLQPRTTRWNELKNLARSEEYTAFICGSDQIWNAATYYVDPFYYLQFAPIKKRISYAPSFGRDKVPDYNIKLIGKYIREIPFLSVREDTGAAIIENLFGEKAVVLPDPTLLLSSEEWLQLLKLSNNPKPYLLAYFLDEPSAEIRKVIKMLARENELYIIGLQSYFSDIKADEIPVAGPREFLNLLKNASLVCTDSFHGTAFSLNFHVPFYTFERTYGYAGKQSTRIISLLKSTNTMKRYCSDFIQHEPIRFNQVSEKLQQERDKAISYLSSALEVIDLNE